MSETPITITYSLEEVLKELKQSINALDQKIDQLTVEVAKLTQKVDGMDERLKSVEGTQKSQVWALIVLLAGAIATAGFKVFFPNP